MDEDINSIMGNIPNPSDSRAVPISNPVVEQVKNSLSGTEYFLHRSKKFDVKSVKSIKLTTNWPIIRLVQTTSADCQEGVNMALVWLRSSESRVRATVDGRNTELAPVLFDSKIITLLHGGVCKFLLFLITSAERNCTCRIQKYKVFHWINVRSILGWQSSIEINYFHFCNKIRIYCEKEYGFVEAVKVKFTSCVMCVIRENWNVLIIIADFCNCWRFDFFNNFNLIEIVGWIIFAAAVTSQCLEIENNLTWVCSYLQLGFCQLNLRIALCRIVFLVSMSVPKNNNFSEKNVTETYICLSILIFSISVTRIFVRSGTSVSLKVDCNTLAKSNKRMNLSIFLFPTKVAR